MSGPDEFGCGPGLFRRLGYGRSRSGPRFRLLTAPGNGRQQKRGATEEKPRARSVHLLVKNTPNSLRLCQRQAGVS